MFSILASRARCWWQPLRRARSRRCSSGSPWLGLLAAIAASVAFALVHGFATITHGGNQIVSGLAINIVAAGLTAQLGVAWFHRGGQTPQLEAGQRFREIELPLAETLRDVPVVGPLYSEIISGHNLLVYLAVALAPLTAWILIARDLACVFAPSARSAAADTAGVRVERMRYLSVACCGGLCGVAGAYLSIAQSAGFIRDMTAGKGYIALAALVFAKWRPMPALARASCSAFSTPLRSGSRVSRCRASACCRCSSCRRFPMC